MLSNFEVMEALKTIKESKNKFGRNLATITYEVGIFHLIQSVIDTYSILSAFADATVSGRISGRCPVNRTNCWLLRGLEAHQTYQERVSNAGE